MLLFLHTIHVPFHAHSMHDIALSRSYSCCAATLRRSLAKALARVSYDCSSFRLFNTSYVLPQPATTRTPPCQRRAWRRHTHAHARARRRIRTELPCRLCESASALQTWAWQPVGTAKTLCPALRTTVRSGASDCGSVATHRRRTRGEARTSSGSEPSYGTPDAVTSSRSARQWTQQNSVSTTLANTGVRNGRPIHCGRSRTATPSSMRHRREFARFTHCATLTSTPMQHSQ